MKTNYFEIEFETTNEVANIINSIGRTEDLAFSPDSTKLAIASYEFNKIIVFDIEISFTISGSKIHLSNYRLIDSPSFKLPHGIAWLNDETIAVANRAGHTVIIKIYNDQNGGDTRRHPLQILLPINTELMHSNDCIETASLGNGFHEIYICSNSGHNVTHYIVDENKDFAVVACAMLIKKGINIPDGVATSNDNKWLAISNHGAHKVYLYKNSESLGVKTIPCAILNGIDYPHGITFSDNHQFIFVADAGAPFVYVFDNKGSEWIGEYNPCAQIRVMDEATFELGHINKQEGGPKGISINSDSSVIAITCSTKPLAFFYVKDLVQPLKKSNSMISEKSYQNERDKVIERLLRVSRNMQDTAHELAIFHTHQIKLLKNSHSWKITRPLRIMKTFLFKLILREL